MTSIFEGQPPKRRPFPIKTRVIWVPGSLVIGEIWNSKLNCSKEDSPWEHCSHRHGVLFYRLVYDGGKQGDAEKGVTFWFDGWWIQKVVNKSDIFHRCRFYTVCVYVTLHIYIYIYILYLHRYNIYTHSMYKYLHIYTLWLYCIHVSCFFRRKLDESGEASRDGTVLGMFSCPRSQWSVTILGTFPEEFLEVYICWTEAHSYCLVHTLMTLIRHIGIPPWLFLKMSSLLNPHFIQGMESFKAFRITIKICEWSMLISYAVNGFKQINMFTPGIYTPIFPTYFWWLLTSPCAHHPHLTFPQRSSLDFRTSAGGA